MVTLNSCDHGVFRLAFYLYFHLKIHKSCVHLRRLSWWTKRERII